MNLVRGTFGFQFKVTFELKLLDAIISFQVNLMFYFKKLIYWSFVYRLQIILKQSSKLKCCLDQKNETILLLFLINFLYVLTMRVLTGSPAFVPYQTHNYF